MKSGLLVGWALPRLSTARCAARALATCGGVVWGFLLCGAVLAPARVASA